MKKILSLILTVTVIILEVLPNGAVLHFANPDSDNSLTEKFSYFDPTSFGYANFGPFLTAVLTVILLIMVIIFLLKSKGLAAVRIISVCAVLTSLLPILMFDTTYFTITGGCITALLIAECVLAFLITDNKI